MRAKLPPQRHVSGETASAPPVRSGVVSGPGSLLELQRAAGNRAVCSALPVQRLAGVEYETGVSARTAAHDPAQPNSGWVEQDKVMWRAAGWEIQSDNSKLEFVTEPAVELDALDGVMTAMLGAIQGATLPGPGAAPTPMDQVLHAGSGRGNYVILPTAQGFRLTGSPQGTIGVPFHRLPAFFRLLENYGLSASADLQQEHAARMRRWREQVAALPADQQSGPQQKLELADRALADEQRAGTAAISPGTMRTNRAVAEAAGPAIAGLDAALKRDPAVRAAHGIDKLYGLLQLIGQYAQVAGSPGQTSYKKKNFAVMTRTSFASMYAALPAQLHPSFRPSADAMLAGLGIAQDTPMFPDSSSRFTVTEWLDSIAVPEQRWIPRNVNPRRLEDYRGMMSDKMTAPGASSAGAGGNYNTDKSMGSMGLDTGELVVVELRTLKHFTNTTFGTFTPAVMQHLVQDLRRLTAL